MTMSFTNYHSLAKNIFGKIEFSEQDKFDISSSLQTATENIIKEELPFFINKFKPKKLCIAGGCALNSVLIGKIQDWFPQITDVYVPPIPHDSGLSIGSSQYLWHQILGNKRIKWKDNFSPYLGRKYSEKQILEALKKQNDLVKYSYSDDEKIIELLAQQNIISVFGGGSESGRRALGNKIYWPI